MNVRTLALAGILIVLGLLPVQAQGTLTARLDQILAAPALRGGITGAIVCEVQTGQTLYEHDADMRLLPASNRKLFTSAAALELLGDEYRIETDLRAKAKPDVAGILGGSLYLHGGGDGLLSPEDLTEMARTLAQSGVKRVAGNIVGDGSRFADGPYGFGWEWDDFSDEEFPQIAGLEANEGVLGVHVVPGKTVGESVTVTLTPPTDYLPVVVQAKTGGENTVSDCVVTRPWDKNYFLVTGTLPVGKTFDQNVPVKDPPLLAATLLREALTQAGIVVAGRAVMGETPPGTVVLTSHQSLPLKQYLARMNKPSDNLLAESLVRLLDPTGTYEAGHARETRFLQSLGVDTGSIALVDGCGVGRRNFVTARSVSRLLLGMHAMRDWPVYYASLPIAGVDGTLKSRMKGTAAENNVHAKTGTLSQARALSGYVTGRNGTLYVFSLLMNNFPGSARSAGDVQDRFVEALTAL
jgi:D-alanyl-D-alanine carboxypeptidase/D-alanyl-D-alanine-endopeptidase (penicillin-binding protein 4)